MNRKQTFLLLTLLTAVAAFTAGCGDSHSVPQFTKLAFYSSRTVSPPTTIFVMKLDGSNVTPVPVTGNNTWDPSISADAKTAALYIEGDAWTQGSDGSAAKQLTTSGNVNFVRMSPSGKKVLYADGSDSHMWIVNPDGSAKLDLTPTLPTGMTECYSGGFSANSALVDFVCTGPGTYGIYTVKVDGTGTTTVVTRSNWVDTPSFSPDGKKVIFANYDYGTSLYSVNSVNIDGSGETVLAPDGYESEILNSTLFYAAYDSDLGVNVIWKANLDGTNKVLLTDGSSDNYLGIYD